MTGEQPRRGGGRPKGSRTRSHLAPAPPHRVVGYARTDTGNGRPSIAKQEEMIRAHCAANGLTLVAMHTDERAGSESLNRPGAQAALASIRNREASALMVYATDRLTTNLVDLCVLLETDLRPEHARLLAVCGDVDSRTAGGRMSLRIMTAVAQCNREGLATAPATIRPTP